MRTLTNVIYEELKQYTHDSYISQYLNLDLFKQIYPYDDLDDNSNEDFKNKYRLKYFGELLERYEERGIVKDIKDLRTLVFTCVHIINSGKYTSQEYQKDDFVSSVLSKLEKDFDYFIAVTILQLKDFSKIKSANLREKILSAIHSGKTTPEMTVYGLYGIYTYYCQYPTVDDSSLVLNQTALREEFDSLDVSIFNNLAEPVYYAMISKMAFRLLSGLTASSFKNKNVFYYLRSMKNMCEKVIGVDVSFTNAFKYLKMDEKKINLLNYFTLKYVATNSLEFNETYSRNKLPISFNKFMGLKLNLWSYLNEPTECPDRIWNELTYDIRSQQYDEHGIHHNASTAIAGKVSKKNFNKILEIQDEIAFHLKGWSDFFFKSKENMKLFNKLNKDKQERIVYGGIDDTEDIEVIRKLFNLAIEAGFDIDQISDYGTIRKFILVHNNLDHLKEWGKIHFSLLECILDNIKNRWSYDDYTRYLLELLQFIKDNKEHPNLNDDTIGLEKMEYHMYQENVLEQIELLDTFSIHDYSLRKCSQQIKDKVVLLNTLASADRAEEGYSYILNNLNNKAYIELMELSREEQLDILDHIKTSILEQSEQGLQYSQQLSNKLNLLILTLEENSHLSLNECKDFITEFKNTNELSLNSKVKLDTVGKNIVNNKDATLNDLRDLLIEVKNKSEDGLLNDDELLKFFKNSLLQMTN